MLLGLVDAREPQLLVPGLVRQTSDVQQWQKIHRHRESTETDGNFRLALRQGRKAGTLRKSNSQYEHNLQRSIYLQAARKVVSNISRINSMRENHTSMNNKGNKFHSSRLTQTLLNDERN